MNDQTDQQLLQQYARDKSEAAFAAIVHRYVDLVYSAALRLSCDAHAAKDVTQGVFVALAQNARQLTDRPALAGWLHGTARNLAVKVVRSDVRRRAREQEAAVMNELLSAHPDASWEHIAPHLDDALGELSEPDRDAVLLRYFKNHDLRTVGATLGISDDAAQKRVSRAVECLREFFAKRGVTVGASGLAVVISANAVQAAPVGLALTLSTAAALTGTTLATTATITATKAIAMTAFQKTLVTVTIAVLTGAGIFEARQAAQLRAQVQTLQQQQAPLVEQFERLQREQADATNRLAALRDDNERLNRNTAELLKLRGEVTRWRNEANSLAKEAMEAKDFQEEMMQALSNMPPVRTFVSSTTTSASWNQAIVTGGWKTPSGKRAVVLVQLYPGEDFKQLTISSKVLEYTETAGEQLGLSQFNFDDQSSGGNARANAHKLTSEQVELLLKSAKDSQGVQLSSAPSVSTLSGRQAQIQAVEVRQTPSGEKYTTGPVIDFIPTISPDGQSVQLVMTAQLNYRIPVPTR